MSHPYHKKYDPLFCITEEAFEEKTSKHYEGVFTQGSGVLHLRGSHEEGLAGASQNEEYMRLPANVTIEKPRHPLSKWGTYIPGVTGLHPLLREECVNLPYLLHLKVFANGKALDMSASVIDSYKRILDMRDGVLYREFIWHPDEKTVLKAFYSRYVSGRRRNLVVQDISFEVLEGRCSLKVQGGIDENVRTNGYNHFSKLLKTVREGDVFLSLTTDNGDEVHMASRIFAEGLDFFEAGGDLCGEIVLDKGQILKLQKLSAASASQKDEVSSPQKLKTVLDQAQADKDNLYKEHDEAWQSLWHHAKVAIEGDDEAQLAVNFSIYHLLRSANPDNRKVSVCAKGFAGEAYFGHFFWDTEIYLLPFFVHTRTEAAKAFCEFRIGSLDGARRNAAAYGYKGAKYPWESSLTGDEQCPNWQYADNEVHINTDVVFGLWHYYCATGDEAFLAEAALVFIETARYWLTRVETRKDGTVNLNGVMGPDEYICFCNNNAYTNTMVSWSLRRTLDVVAHIKDRDVESFLRLGVSQDELDQMRDVAEKLPVRTLDDGTIMQCDHFETFEEPDFDNIWTDRSRPFGHFVSQERNYRTKALKQADVLMLPYLFPSSMSREQLTRNYGYYYPYTTHDSSLSVIIHSILCSRLDRREEAYELFLKSLDIDLGKEKAGAAEGIHIANCGGIWQAIVYGFAGMQPAYETSELVFRPRLPKHWKSLSFNILHRGEPCSVTIEGDGARVERREAE